MLVFILTLSAFTVGGLFGAWTHKTIKDHKLRNEQKSLLQRTPTFQLEDELNRRGDSKISAYR
jgi:hypothetical protein